VSEGCAFSLGLEGSTLEMKIEEWSVKNAIFPETSCPIVPSGLEASSIREERR